MAKEEKKLHSFNSFNAGEYSPDLAGRVDIESFGSSARCLLNMLSLVSGGVKKFYGTTHVTEVVPEWNRAKIKFVPFINQYEPMAFVFWGIEDEMVDGGSSISIGLVCGNSYKPLDIKFPSSVNVNEMRWKQINDVILFAHKSIQPTAIKFYGKNELGEYVFVSENISFKDVPYFPVGTTDDFAGTLIADGLSGRVNLTISDSVPEVRAYLPSPMDKQSTYTRHRRFEMGLAALASRANSSSVSLLRVRGGTETVLCSGVCNVTNKSDHTITDTITREKILQVVKSVYSDSKIVDDYIKIDGVDDHQNGDSYYMTLSIGSMYMLGGEELFPAKFSTSKSHTPSTTSLDALNAKDWVGRKIKFYIDSKTVVQPWWQGKKVDRGDYVFSNGHWYKADNSGDCGNVQPSHTSGIMSDGNVSWIYVHSGSNTATVVDISEKTETKTITITVLVTGGELPANKFNDEYIFENYAWSIWGRDGVHPSDIYMVGNRLGFVCNTRGYGAWNSLSVVDDYFDFSTEEYGQQLDTSAIVHLIPNNESGVICWVLSRKNVYMGSYSGEFNIKSPNDVLTPLATQTDNISNTGGKAVVPLKYKELNLFVGSTGKELYTIGYDYTIDDYTPQSLGYMTDHIMDKGITRLEALNNKDRNIYLLHNTKQLSLLHYVKEQKILGFSELNLGCDVLDFVTTYAQDEVAGYVATKRNDGKVTIERLATAEPTYMWDAINIEGEFTGVAHHANKEVWVKYGDGLSQFVRVTLDDKGVSNKIPKSNKYQVGLPMMCEIHTQPAFGDKVEGHQQQSLYIYARLNKSGSFDYGSSVDFSKYVHYDAWKDSQDWDGEKRLYTGDIMLNIPLGYAEAANVGDGPYPNTTGVGVNFRSDTPEPFNLLSIQEIYK